MEFSSTTTRVSGLLPDVRSVLLSEWSDKYFKPVKALMAGMVIHEARGIAGQWIGHLKTNDERLCAFFQKNFTPASAEPRPDLFLYAFTDVDDEDFLKSFHDVRTPGKLKSFVDGTSEKLRSPGYAGILNDAQLLRFDELPEDGKIEAALQKPSAMYVPELNIFVMVNVDCYMVLRNQGFFGMLKRLVVSKTGFTQDGKLADPSEVWLPMSSGVVELPGDEEEKEGVVFLSNDPSLRASLAIGLTNGLSGAKYLAADISYVNVRTKKMVAIERRSLVPGSAIAADPEILPGVLANGIENFRVGEEVSGVIERMGSSDVERSSSDEFPGGEITLSLRKDLSEDSVFGMFGPADFWPKSKLTVSSKLGRLFVITMDFDDSRILEATTREEAVRMLSSENNVSVFAVTTDGGLPKKLYSMRSPWFDGHWVVRGGDAEEQFARKRDEIMNELLGDDISYFMLNGRIPATQLAFCVLNNLSGEFDSVSIKPESEVDRILCAKLKVFRRSSPGEGKESILYTPDGRRANVLCFHRETRMTYYAAVDAEEVGPHFVKSYSRGTVTDFFLHHSHSTQERPARSAV